ncbi:hypothetical protein F0726_01153 [Acidithiobacillus caldus]|nr:hypothetical protein F0726_01153 [Acidithiobacillus caldus]
MVLGYKMHNLGFLGTQRVYERSG